MRSGTITGLAIGATLLFTATANAAETIGSALTTAPTNPICGVCDGSGTQTVKATGSPFPLTPSSDGVLVSLRLKHGPTTATPGDTFGFRFLTGVSGTVFNARKAPRLPNTSFGTNVPAGTTEIVPTDATGQPQGVKILSTERIGVLEDNDPGHFGPNTLNNAAAGAVSQLNAGLNDTGAFDYAVPFPGGELLVQATVEPDADGDEYGDETQDQCVNQTGTVKGCDKEAPTALLVKHPKAKSTSPTATFKFSSDDPAATFQCAIDKKALKACNSPKKFKKLKPKKHKFQLVATDAASNASAPTVFRWRVVD